MSINGRNKGANFERDIAKKLHLELGLYFKRNLDQYQAKGQDDLRCEDASFKFSLELKRYASGAFQKSWWQQAKSQSGDKWPCVIYKFDRKPITARLPLAFFMDDPHDQTVDVNFETFIYIARETI